MTMPTALNNHDEITGWFGVLGSDISDIQGFLRSPSGEIITFVVDPQRQTRPGGINDAGMISGTVGWGENELGFVGTPNNFTTFSIPGAVSTHATGINNRNEITGWYIDDIGRQVPFVITATPAQEQAGVPEPGSFMLFAGGILLCGSGHRWLRRTGGVCPPIRHG